MSFPKTNDDIFNYIKKLESQILNLHREMLSIKAIFHNNNNDYYYPPQQMLPPQPGYYPPPPYEENLYPGECVTYCNENEN